MSDVLVVGAGLAGCSVAWHLSADARVRVIDGASQPGAEASAQNAGMIRLLGEDPVERSLALRTDRLLGALGEDWDGLDVGRVTGALMALAEDDAHLNDAVAWARARGVDVQACDRPAEVAPILTGARLRRAWFLPRARVADAHALITGFVRGVRRRGGRVDCGAAALRLRVSAGRCVGVDTPDGPLRAGRVVLAAGAWSAGLARTAGLERPLFPLRRSLLQSESHRLARSEHPWTWLDDVGLYVRPEAGGWLGSACEESVDWPNPGAPSRGQPESLQIARFAEKLRIHLPALRPERLSGWTGLRTFAPDRRPLLGADPDLAGLWWAAGLGGFGVTCSLAVGETVAEWMRGRTVPWLSPEIVSPGRPFPGRWTIRPTGECHQPRLIGGRMPAWIPAADQETHSGERSGGQPLACPLGPWSRLVSLL